MLEIPQQLIPRLWLSFLLQLHPLLAVLRFPPPPRSLDPDEMAFQDSYSNLFLLSVSFSFPLRVFTLISLSAFLFIVSEICFLFFLDYYTVLKASPASCSFGVRAYLLSVVRVFLHFFPWWSE